VTDYLSDDDAVKLLQLRLKQHGYFDGAVLGNFGPLTLAALDAVLPSLEPAVAKAPEWIAVGMEALGWHEQRDNAKLRAFLKRDDGQTLGDPASLPWCGDFVKTCVRIALPMEDYPGPLGENPYWALNWQFFGMRLEEPMLGCVAYKSRDGGGHVTFPVGRSESGKTLYCLGGNQSNVVSIAAYPRTDFMGFRYPKTEAHPPKPLPVMDGSRLPSKVSEF
jgi:uncharacterized protein (TIGR02594 family)